MKKDKIAWLVTHDAYIDRRILFFADVLLENGYTVKLFPAAYTDFTNDHDPDYVVRPLDWTVVKLYGLSLASLMEEERGLLERTPYGAARLTQIGEETAQRCAASYRHLTVCLTERLALCPETARRAALALMTQLDREELERVP